MPSWLAERVGPTGRVLATDIDVSWMTADADACYEVRCHDVGVDPPPGDGFDLVHARLVLVHVPQRATGLAGMVSALRPGGRLLVEEATR
jgi:ubiquinone/menaquinone biosynthesis C-methylase UbiE